MRWKTQMKNAVSGAARSLGWEVRRLRRPAPPHPGLLPVPARVAGIHYGCGKNLVRGWLNVDHAPPSEGVPDGVHFLAVDLSRGHPFADGSFELGYAEDFLEHLSQAESLAFLYEARRTLRPGGTLRLSFPGLEGVLRRHYRGGSPRAVAQARWEAYDAWEHVHFYSREELRLVATHAGFAGVEFGAFGRSRVAALAAMDTREGQADLNTYADLAR